MLRKSVFLRIRKLRVRPGEGSSVGFSGVSSGSAGSGCLAAGVVSGEETAAGQFSSGGLVVASSSLRDRRVDLVGVSWDSSDEDGSSTGDGSGGVSGWEAGL